MAWLEITLDTVSEKIESVAAQLTAQGFAELVIEDQAEFETFLDENRAYWDYIDEDLQEKLQGLSHIKLYLEDTQKEDLARLERAAEQLGLPMEVKSMAETNWEESWKDNYPAVEVGENLIVVPYWAAEETGGRTPVILDPGLTFGTGAHASTQMVMEFMEQTVVSDYKSFQGVSVKYEEDANQFADMVTQIYASITDLNSKMEEISNAIVNVNETITESADGVTMIAEKSANAVEKTADGYKIGHCACCAGNQTDRLDRTGRKA